jgi:hypothetical protein
MGLAAARAGHRPSALIIRGCADRLQPALIIRSAR